MKKLFLFIFIFSLLFPLISLAGTYQSSDGSTVTYDGLVPCGKIVKVVKTDGSSSTKSVPCQFCHFFVMFKAILDLFLTLVIIIAVLMIVYGGFLYLTGGSNPGQIQTAMKVLTSTAIGLIIIFAAWVIVNTIFIFLGVAGWTGLQSGWFQISCPITIP